jgi:effector-binding domain-containing protein
METLTEYKVHEIAWPGKTFITKRATINFDRLTDFFRKTYSEIYNGLENIGVLSTEPPCAIFYSIDEAKQETDLCAAIPVNKVDEIDNFEKVIIPKSKALMVPYYGSYENMVFAYASLEKYVNEHYMQRKWIVEQYFSDPIAENDPSKWKTNIYFIVE